MAAPIKSTYSAIDTPHRIKFKRALLQTTTGSLNEVVLTVVFNNLKDTPIKTGSKVKLLWLPRKSANDGKHDVRILNVAGKPVGPQLTDSTGKVVFRWTQRIGTPSQNEGTLIYIVTRTRTIRTTDVFGVVLF